MNLRNLLLASLVGILCSCGETDEFASYVSNSERIESFTLNATYGGKDYHVPCLLVVDKDSIIFLDEDFRELFYNEISNLPNLVCEVKEDGSVEYKSEIVDDSVSGKKQKEQILQTRASNEVYLQFFKDANYKGKSQKITLTNPLQRWENANLTFAGWSKNISAIKAYNNNYRKVYLYAYDQQGYKGNVLKYVLYSSGVEIEDHTKVEIPNLGKIPMSGGGNWNDKIVSMKFHY